ncbi:hypothetical protein SAMN05444008_101319 [Cnuella takakiae]|uniref:DUF2264 domain-containing protein n=1 Tax=Cnuella takakiae TaxID=1302690 RepID=A0A1M4T2E1_9BACT|nr:DUF2264 domain-containing protein [Cnuella takakiae]OLY90664.1 hypothetical protein BUE76_01170 [Cnuella takakiae]SHE38564.1 hypothetical protein SAMN05444008_101319 [Cnuella takakiae]
MKKVLALICTCFFLQVTMAQKATDRQLWLRYLDKVARPVFSNLAADNLKANMPVQLAPKVDNAQSRTSVSYLEAFGRTLSGIGPWLNNEGGGKEEVALRNQYRQWALQALANAVNPAAKDYLQWNGGQPLVDASFLAFGLVRCPWLWDHADSSVKAGVVTAFKQTRATVPAYTNWILFSGMIEAFFCRYGYEYDVVRIEFAVREFAHHWYVGDGLFSDGMNFAMDYYNSIVIHPYLASIVDIINGKTRRFGWFAPHLDKINKRYAEIQERSINTDGSFPVFGRSIAYRSGVFHHLADMALRNKLPESLSPAAVRSALAAVLQKTLGAPKTFNERGWLNIGLHGAQPGLGEPYITTGSLYLAAHIFLPLGLPDTDPFWAAPAAPWTAVKVWNGEDIPADHAVEVKY